MRRWTETEAVEYLLKCGAEKVSAKRIYKKGGWNGLKACSAMDFLKGLNYYLSIPSSTTDTGRKKPVSVCAA